MTGGGQPCGEMDVLEKLTILTDAAKYDAACTSSGGNRRAKAGYIGNTTSSIAGCCHSFSADGRCVTLLKVLMTNRCVYDCKYCVNRRSNEAKRAMFTPEELADLTIQFYRRNYIEGLFLSSGVYRSPDYTTELMIRALRILREEYRFNGYIHAKAIPGTAPELVEQMGFLADRLSVNIELPSNDSLKRLAPQKSKENILLPMSRIRDGIKENAYDLIRYKSAPRFVPGGQSTQMIIGATPENDRRILQLSEGLYHKYSLKRVFYSAYIPVVQDRNLPALDTAPPLLREHRLYQADWLLRFYGFTADELLSEKTPDLDPMLDPKCSWAVRHPEEFPVEVNRAPYEKLLRVPGIGVVSAKRIIRARRQAKLDHEGLKKLGVVLKRASYFITCNGKMQCRLRTDEPAVLAGILRDRGLPQGGIQPEIPEQLSLFNPTKEDAVKCLTGQL